MSALEDINVTIVRTDDATWRVAVTDGRGKILDSHELADEPTPESVKALIAEAHEHHDALERLVHR